MMTTFNDVYASNKQMIWKLVSRFASNLVDREDLFQEVFLKIYKALPNFREEAKIETWIYKITINTSINYINKKKRQEKIIHILAGFRLIEQVEEKEEIDIYQPLNKLNARQRSILVLIDLEEKSLEKASNILKLPIGTIKSNLHRAREIVKKEVLKNEKL